MNQMNRPPPQRLQSAIGVQRSIVPMGAKTRPLRCQSRTANPVNMARHDASQSPIRSNEHSAYAFSLGIAGGGPALASSTAACGPAGAGCAAGNGAKVERLGGNTEGEA